VIEREMLVERTLSDGSTAPLTGPAAKFSRTPTSIRRTAPPPGADTEEVLAELDGRISHAEVVPQLPDG
jgi:formyl-CoA transferase